MNKALTASYTPLKEVDSILQSNTGPWIVAEAVNYLHESLTKEMVGVEFGAGCSTTWFCERLKYLHTFECSQHWAVGTLNRVTKDPNINNKWCLHYSNCDWNKDSLGNRWFIKNGHHLRTKKEMDAMEDHFMGFSFNSKIDFCFVDGSIRYDTYVKSLELLSKNEGAILCIDNSEKPHRAKYVDELTPTKWEKLEFVNNDSNDVEAGSKTTIFRIVV